MPKIPEELALIQGTKKNNDPETFDWIGHTDLPVAFSVEFLEQQPGLIDYFPWKLEFQYKVVHPEATQEPTETHIYKRYADL